MNALELSKLKELSKQGDNEAKYELAIQLLSAKFCNPDIPEAIRLLEEASETSNRARKLIASYYFNGQFVEKDISKAIDLFQKAANDLDFESCEKLGAIYYAGISLQRNKDLANGWFKLSHINFLKLSILKVQLNFARLLYLIGKLLNS